MTGARGIDRRSFLVSIAATGGALTLGFDLHPAEAASAPEITAWIVIDPDDTVIIRVARSEMGQGSLTALPMLVAEELECDWAKVKPEYVPPHESLVRHRAWGEMGTNASRAISGSQDYLRRAGATAREMLVTAAAERWKVSAPECRARNGVITHLPSGRTVSFGSVAKAAAAVQPPADVTLKDPQDWTLIGTSQKHFGLVDRVTGAPIYGIDVRVPRSEEHTSELQSLRHLVCR